MLWALQATLFAVPYTTYRKVSLQGNTWSPVTAGSRLESRIVLVNQRGIIYVVNATLTDIGNRTKADRVVLSLYTYSVRARVQRSVTWC